MAERHRSEGRSSNDEPPISGDDGVSHHRIHRRINRKMDLALLPLLSLIYLFNGLDRGNVGNAETQGTAPYERGRGLRLSLWSRSAHTDSFCRLHKRHWRKARRPQRRGVPLLRHLCDAPTNLGGSGAISGSSSLDSYHDGIIYPHRRSSMGRLFKITWLMESVQLGWGVVTLGQAFIRGRGTFPIPPALRPSSCHSHVTVSNHSGSNSDKNAHWRL
jgi:hypothetical protein